MCDANYAVSMIDLLSPSPLKVGSGVHEDNVWFTGMV